MREIKFRGRATEDYETSQITVQKGEWVYGYYAILDGNHVIVTRLLAEDGGMGDGCAECVVNVDFKTVGQYTGRKDKEINEIYDGDIIDIFNHNVEVVFNLKLGGWCFKHSNDSMYQIRKECREELQLEENGRCELMYWNVFLFKVIGNIHQNSGLLK